MLELAPDSPIRQVTLETEEFVADDGWGQDARLFALVYTRDIVAVQPELAEHLGDPDSLTPVEQDVAVDDAELEQWLPQVQWPASVAGCAVVIERPIKLLETDSIDAGDAAAEPGAAGVDEQMSSARLVAAALRDGSTHTTVRIFETPENLLEGPQLVDVLLELVQATLN